MLTAEGLLTYQGYHETHWGKRIILAEKTGKFTPQDHDDATNWNTCACGKQDPAVPRTAQGIPLDKELANFGVNFDLAVQKNDFLCAAEILEKIEKQAVYVLKKPDEKL